MPEATYNRALTLVRLGRNKQAVAALKPIAAGRFGDYRRHEAEALLGALSASSGPRSIARRSPRDLANFLEVVGPL